MTPAQLSHLTPEERAAWERCEKSTPGPWTLDPHFGCYLWGPQMQMIADDGLEFNDEAAYLFRLRGVGAGLPLKDNGEFIAHARTDLPATLETIAGLREREKVMREALEAAQDFVASEMRVRQQSYLPNPTPDEQADIDEASSTLAGIEAALAQREGKDGR